MSMSSNWSALEEDAHNNKYFSFPNGFRPNNIHSLRAHSPNLLDISFSSQFSEIQLIPHHFCCILMFWQNSPQRFAYIPMFFAVMFWIVLHHRFCASPKVDVYPDGCFSVMQTLVLLVGLEFGPCSMAMEN